MAKTPASKLLVNIVLLAIAAVITNIYVMDSEAMQRGHQKTINLYEVFDTSPQDFAQLNQTDIKRLYRDLSRKYHPDKNREEDTTDKFMNIKQAFEILSNQEKRVLYDVYGTVDFSQDDKMKDMIE
jgi:preprotein translocase subunit Sec63